MRVLDALVRWYAQPPAANAPLAEALDHAQRLLRPGAQLVVLADAGSAAQVPTLRWTALARHHQATLVLLQDPLEVAPPRRGLDFLAGGRRLRLALDLPGVRGRWEHAFLDPARELARSLPAMGWQLRLLSTDAASADWLRPQACMDEAGTDAEAVPARSWVG